MLGHGSSYNDLQVAMRNFEIAQHILQIEQIDSLISGAQRSSMSLFEFTRRKTSFAEMHPGVVTIPSERYSVS